MPMRPLKPCRHPGCPRLTEGRFCKEHEKDNQRASASERGYTTKWQNRSKMFLKRNPLCVNCKQMGKLTPATVVDHIIQHRGNEQLMWDESNWQPLCKKCHDKKTGKFDRIKRYEYR